MTVCKDKYKLITNQNMINLCDDARYKYNCYCGEGYARISEIMIYCKLCRKWFHSSCCKVLDKTKIILGETNYTFICKNCKKVESFEMHQKTWNDVICHALFYLFVKNKKQYFHWKRDICDFIDTNWDIICRGKKRTKTWWNTVVSQLSQNRTMFNGIGNGNWNLNTFIPSSKKRNRKKQKSRRTTKKNNYSSKTSSDDDHEVSSGLSTVDDDYYKRGGSEEKSEKDPIINLLTSRDSDLTQYEMKKIVNKESYSLLSKNEKTYLSIFLPEIDNELNEISKLFENSHFTNCLNLYEQMLANGEFDQELRFMRNIEMTKRRRKLKNKDVSPSNILFWSDALVDSVKCNEKTKKLIENIRKNKLEKIIPPPPPPPIPSINTYGNVILGGDDVDIEKGINRIKNMFKNELKSEESLRLKKIDMVVK